MLKMRNELLEFAERASTHRNLDMLARDFSDVIDRQGFWSFILTGLPAVGHNVEPLIVANRWPAGWTERYVEQSYFDDDPVTKWSLRLRRPFRWHEAWQANTSTARVKQINGEAAELRLRDGVALPIASFDGARTVISLASNETLELGPGAEHLLYTAGVFFQIRAAELVRQTHQPQARLTDREREVLKWAAAGKTSWETSEILSVAERTIQNQLATIRLKLDAANTTHAVAKAIFTGLIQP